MITDYENLRAHAQRGDKTNAELARRVQDLEAALDKAADDVAFLRNRLDVQAEQDAAALRDAQDDAARLRAALEKVEYVALEDYWTPMCAWCQSRSDDGHATDCQRQAALAQTSEVKLS